LFDGVGAHGDDDLTLVARGVCDAVGELGEVGEVEGRGFAVEGDNVVEGHVVAAVGEGARGERLSVEQRPLHGAASVLGLSAGTARIGKGYFCVVFSILRRQGTVFIALLEAMRPRQWMKNVFVLAAIAFGERFWDRVAVEWSIAAFIVFCFLSSSVYIVNDVVDAEQDRQHPRKRKRPIASGRLPVAVAVPAAILLAVFSIRLALAINPGFTLCAGLYLVLNLLYSFWLKRVVILDVLLVAIFFVLRAAAGAEAINVEISRWLVICTLTLALFIALSKRRHELVLLDENASAHRVSLTEYTPYLLDQMIAVATASTLMTYVLYTVDTRTIEAFGRALPSVDASPFIYTIPCVVYGIFRYLYLIHQRGEGGDPDRIVLSDGPFFVNLVVWVGIVGLVIRFF